MVNFIFIILNNQGMRLLSPVDLQAERISITSTTKKDLCSEVKADNTKGEHLPRQQEVKGVYFSYHIQLEKYISNSGVVIGVTIEGQNAHKLRLLREH